MRFQYLEKIVAGDFKSIARCISLVENEWEGSYELLQSLPQNNIPVIGITGPPGAGKSSLTDALIGLLVEKNKKVAVLCVDPSSPFNLGALLGDRIRMNRWYNSPGVFIRSLATRGSLGGLHPKIIEITDIVRAAPFDFVIVETVGVGQSEIEIAGLADITIVVMVPESGDEVQTMKAGIMEIADIFVVNKSDRPGADLFIKNLQLTLSINNNKVVVPILKTSALNNEGITELLEKINLLTGNRNTERKTRLLAEKAFHLIQTGRMKDIDKEKLQNDIINEGEDFNLYTFVSHY